MNSDNVDVILDCRQYKFAVPHHHVLIIKNQGNQKANLWGDDCFGYAGSQQQQWSAKGYRTGTESLKEVPESYEEMLRGMMATPYHID